MTQQPESLDPALAVLAEHAAAADGELAWPVASWEALRRACVLEDSVPPAYGGRGLEGGALLEVYELVAGACMTTALILSQREAACRRLRDGDNEELRQELLPSLARGDTFATVGLSQLTTSRQHVRPSLAARLDGDLVQFDGIIPWVTGAERADVVVIGAVLDDGRQVLAALPRAMEGVTVSPPLELMALRGSLTAEVRCDHVALERRWLLAGPKERVLAAGRGGAGGLETSCLALGLTAAAIDYLLKEAEYRPELHATADPLEQTRRRLREQLYRLAQGGSPEEATALRGRANALVLQATQAALAASKGAGFLRDHPAQRWARQAMFFLVWSCPRPAAEATLAHLTPMLRPDCS
jgi:alkylation response protein AidB-like acyl-CoA dehydrogenase